MSEPTHGLRQPNNPSALHAEITLVCDDLAASGVLTEQSVRRLRPILERFGWFASNATAVASLAEVCPATAERFVMSRAGRRQTPPSTATMHVRRSAVRLLFRTGRRLGSCTTDPTIDIELPARSSLRSRPLTDDEVAVCRAASLHSLEATRLPAAWALAEATVRSGEMAAVRVEDIELRNNRVWIAGSSRTAPRWGEFTAWGHTQVRRRLAAVGDATLLIYAGDGSAESRQASSCQAIHETLVRAGLAREPDVRPVSVAAWAGRCTVERSGRIDEAARQLGLRSLDRTAAMTGWGWTHIDEP